MAIKAVITAEEYGALDAALKPLYKQEGNSYVADIDGIDAHPSTKSLKTALDAERSGRSDTTRQLNELKAKLGDMDPDEARDALKKIQELEEKSRLGEIPDKFKKQFDEAVAARVESIQKNFETQKKGFEKQVKDLETKLNESTGQLENLTIDGAVREAASKKGLHAWAIEDAVMHARKLYKLKDGKPVPLNGDQVVFSGKKPGDPKPIEEWLEEKITEKPGWVKESTGGGADHQRNNGAGGQFVLTRAQARDVATYNRTKEAAKKVGQEVQILEQ